MVKFILFKLKEEKGISTVEVIIIIAILVAVALIFRNAIFNFVNNLISTFFEIPSMNPNVTPKP